MRKSNDWVETEREELKDVSQKSEILELQRFILGWNIRRSFGFIWEMAAKRDVPERNFQCIVFV